MVTIQSKRRVIYTKEEFEFHGICRKTKLKPCKIPALPVLLQGCETWKMKKDDRKVDVFYNRFLRKILQMYWKDHATTKDLLERADYWSHPEARL